MFAITRSRAAFYELSLGKFYLRRASYEIESVVSKPGTPGSLELNRATSHRGEENAMKPRTADVHANEEDFSAPDES